MFTKRAGEPEHNHKLDVCGAGTGQTIDTSDGHPHTHEIKDWVVSAYERDDMPKHDHDIAKDGLVGFNDTEDLPRVEIEDRTPIKFKIEVEIPVERAGASKK